MKWILALVLAVLVALSSTPARAESALEQAGYGAGSFLGSLVYSPLKGAFCILGGIGSGVAFVAGGPDAAGKVAATACGGTWLITPGVLKGEEKVKFFGEPQQRAEAPTR